MQRLALVLAITLCAGGCKTRPLDPDEDGGTPSDLAGADLKGLPDMTQQTCRTHERAFVNISKMSLVDANPQLGRAIRVRVEIPLRQGCDVLADLSTAVQIGNATDFVVITARAWRGSAPCGPEETTQRVVTISDFPGPFTNPRIVVSDGAPGGMAMLTIMPASSSGTCGPTTQTCSLDCQCPMGTRCVPRVGNAGCTSPCSEDVDCPSGNVCTSMVIDAPFTCQLGAGQTCCTAGCPFGQSCQLCRCELRPPGTGASCRCNSDCAVNEICATRLEIDGDPISPICVTPCVGDNQCAMGKKCTIGRCQ
jgi:hypothetical protein